MECERGFKRNQSRSAISGIVVFFSSPRWHRPVILEGRGRSTPYETVRDCKERSCVLDAGVYSASSRAGKTRRAWLSRLSSLLFFVYTNRMRGARIIAEQVANANLRSCDRALCVFSRLRIISSKSEGNFSNSRESFFV